MAELYVRWQMSGSNTRKHEQNPDDSLLSGGDGGALPDPRPQDHRTSGAEDKRLRHGAEEEHMVHDDVKPIGDVDWGG